MRIKKSKFLLGVLAAALFLGFFLFPIPFTHATSASSRDYLSEENINYLIVTRNRFEGGFENFAAWKESEGFSVFVETVGEIIQEYKGKDIPAKIRNCIKRYYTENGAKWVLLVGDADPSDRPPKGGTPTYALDENWEVPVRYLWNPGKENYTPSDYYYAGLDNDWDADNDGKFGESKSFSVRDEADWRPEVYVGRWPVRTLSQLRNIVQKTVKFGQRKTSSENFLILGARFGSGYSSGNTSDIEVREMFKSVKENFLPDSLEVHTFYEPFPFNSVATSSNGSNIAVGGGGGEVRFFSRTENKPLWSYRVGREIKSITLSSKGRFIGATSGDGNLYLFDNEGQVEWIFQAWKNKYSVDSSVDISKTGDYIVAGGNSNNFGKVYLFRKTDNKPAWSYKFDDKVLSISISGTGSTVAVGTSSGIYLFGKYDNLPLWSYHTESRIGSVCISSEGDRIVASAQGEGPLGEAEKKIYYFGNSDNTPIWTFSGQKPNKVCSVSISKDGSHIAGGGASPPSILLFENTENTPSWTYSISRLLVSGFSPSVEISPNKKYVIAGGCGRVYFFRKSDNTPEWIYHTNFPGDVKTVSLTDNGKLAASAGQSGCLYLFEKNENIPLWTYSEKKEPSLIQRNVIKAINRFDPVFIDSYSHGTSGYLVLGRRNHLVFMEKSTVNQLKNTGYLHFATACNSSAFDISETALGEKFIRSPSSGAVGYIGSIRESYGRQEKLRQTFWNTFFKDNLWPYRPGFALYEAKASAFSDFELLSEGRRRNLFGMNLLGDPGLFIAPFSKVEHDLSTAIDPSGAGSVKLDPSGGTYEKGIEVTVTAEPSSGFVFDNWTGDYPSGHRYNNQFTITMDSNKSVTAHFREEELATSKNVELQSGWNLFSLPLDPENAEAGEVFDEFEELPTIYGWRNGYESVDAGDNLEVGQGYWVYVEEAENITVTGTPVENLTLSLDAGWNLAGLPSGVLPRTPGNIFGQAPTIYGWANGYRQLRSNQSFEPGQGYWIYSKQAENITVS